MPAGVSAYVPLANLTLSSSAASVTFSSISQSYRDLILVMTPQTDGFAGGPFITFNGSSATYITVFAETNGTSQNTNVVSTATGIRVNPESYMSSAQGNQITIVNIMDYSATDKHKTLVARYGSGDAAVGMSCARWPSTSAITSLKLDAAPNGRNLITGSSFALYGVSA